MSLQAKEIATSVLPSKLQETLNACKTCIAESTQLAAGTAHLDQKAGRARGRLKKLKVRVARVTGEALSQLDHHLSGLRVYCVAVQRRWQWVVLQDNTAVEWLACTEKHK